MKAFNDKIFAPPKGGLVSLGVLVEMLKIDDSILGVLACISQIGGSLIYAFADGSLMMYIGKPTIHLLCNRCIERRMLNLLFFTQLQP